MARSPDRRARKQPRWALLLAASLAGLAAGCLEQEREIRDWIRKNGESYYEEIIRQDASARFAKVFSEALEAVGSALDTSAASLDNLEAAIRPASLPPASEELEALRKSYFEAFDLWVAQGSLLDSQLIAIRRQSARLQDLLNLCENAQVTGTLPPSDLGGILASTGGTGFRIYLGVAGSLTAGAPSGISPDYSGMGENFLRELGNELTHAIGSWFSSAEDRRALEEASRIAREKLPTYSRRSELARQSCQRIRDAQRNEGESAARTAALLQEYASVLDARAQHLLGLLASRATGLYSRVSRVALTLSEFSSGEEDSALLILQGQLEDYEAASAAMEAARALLLETVSALDRRDCPGAREALSRTERKAELLKALRAGDSVEDPLAYGFARKEAWIAGRLDHCRTRVLQECGGSP